MAVLEVDHLVKRYRRGPRANDGVTLRAEEGEVLGLLGHNGAGKTTLINQVVGLARPTSGTIRLAGGDPVADPASARAACALMPQSQVPLDGITPRQAVETTARIRGAPRQRARARTGDLLAALDIEEWADTAGEHLSGGVRRLTAFAMTAAEPGRLVIMDEPTNDVDPVRRRLLWAQVRALAAGGRAVLLVTHNVAEAERSADRLAVMDSGRVVAEGTPAGLRAGVAGDLRLDLLMADADAPEVAFAGAGRPHRVGRRIIVPLPADAADAALACAQRLRAAGRIEEFALTPVSLEDVYIGLVGGGSEEGHHGALAA
ncbi:ABC-2 type transport system ATP-binding protein [Murinocardiopsis flavida]|uniref:ABC-2 type transport system ATP-binding protein n=1 Tax=Murinocardiopsis flavida TaxID=645275 RepID=A0A2P8D6U0_9ACTN|nr:ABC transporter ATP-binding protein [Murinocardiopsis flavida]PSK92946.1 ABC-2 type transport system ATP-binding protein [Murinocardiopsis flavida]